MHLVFSAEKFANKKAQSLAHHTCGYKEITEMPRNQIFQGIRLQHFRPGTVVELTLALFGPLCKTLAKSLALSFFQQARHSTNEVVWGVR